MDGSTDPGTDGGTGVSAEPATEAGTGPVTEAGTGPVTESRAESGAACVAYRNGGLVALDLRAGAVRRRERRTVAGGSSFRRR